ncbi:hypothetical protein CTRI78_v008958 [Colletotrichum trifolii]|uniref:MARVEL domain-containing protein n=1 Tax=Colletotrichum trifolii TaxID=5466 RepID=A0A4R8QRY8_COLTR|nr:hypothetical protein CTRI78_v008958 [Colletotrichum trifolii]
MARPRIPALYGILQFCLRLILVVFEVCALAALIYLSRYGFDFPIGYVTSVGGILFSMTEMVTLANATHQIPRLRTGALVVCDFVLFVLGLVAFFYFIILNGWRDAGTQREFRAFRDDPLRVEKATWAPWYMWLQLIAAVLHFLYMVMHCVDACKEAPEQEYRRQQRRRRRAIERTRAADPETAQVGTR